MQFSLKKLKNAHFLSLFGNGSIALLNMIIMATLYRHLPLKENGIWIFYQALITFIDTFRTGFLTTAFVKFVAGASKSRAEEVIGSSWFTACIITGLIILVNIPALFFLDYIRDGGLLFFIRFVSVFLILSLPSLIAICIAQGQMKFERILYIRSLQQIFFFVVILILIFLKNLSIATVVYANLACTLLLSIIILSAGWSEIKLFNKKTKSCVTEIYHFGKFSVGTSLSSSLFRVTDTTLINFMIGPGTLAIYSLGQRLMEIVEIPLRSFIATAMPSISKAYNENKKTAVVDIMKKYIGMVTVALVPVLVLSLFFADFAIGIIGGQKYIGTEASNVYRIFMTFALLYPADRFIAITLDVIHKPQINFIKVLLMVVINLVSDLALLYAFGNIYGIAIATVFPIGFAVLFGYYNLQKHYMKFRFWEMYSLGAYELKSLIRSNLPGRYKKIPG